MDGIEVRTTKRMELIDITDKVQQAVAKSKIKQGICFLFIPHTTAGVTINENADPSVKRDILSALNKLIPQGAGYTHSEGNADSHIKSSILGNCLYIFIENNKLLLGTWQGIFFAEGDGPRTRQVWVKII
jgi:secondary thiamine-phosphate synthase enzyme